MTYLTLLGFTAACLTTASFVPQAVRVWRSRSTKDVSLAMFLLMFVGIGLWLLYGLLQNDLPIIVANGVTLALSGSIIVAKLKYG